MSTFTVEPGTRLAGRYILEERVSETSGCSLWKAVDEPLARSVAVRTFEQEFPRTRQVVAAARAASRVTDSRFAQVFDADDSGDHQYVVSEWISGEPLSDLLAGGPLEPGRAAVLVGEAAEALAVAHAKGLAHLRLDPDTLIWTRGGAVKITGLAITAAVHGAPTSEDPGAVDARALGALLYAALTATWPDGDVGGLPAAPHVNGHLCSVHQVRAGVPPALDAIVERSLGQHGSHGLAPLTTPAAVADVLAEVPRPAPPPVPEPPLTTPGGGAPPPGGGPPPRPYPAMRPPERSSKGRTLLLGMVGVLVVAAVGLGGWQLLGLSGGAQQGGGPQASTTPAQTQPAIRPLPINGIQAYDPLGDNQENSDEASLAIDGDPQTAWSTQTYYHRPDLGGLKPGVGLLLDMGKPVAVSDVRLRLIGQGTSVQLRVSGQPPQDPNAMRTVARSSNAGEDVTLTPQQPERARYLLLWLTELPPVQGGFQGQVASVVVQGK